MRAEDDVAVEAGGSDGGSWELCRRRMFTGAGKSDVGTGIVLTSDSKPGSGTCVVFTRLDAGGMTTVALPLPLLLLPVSFSEGGPAPAFFVFGLGFGLGLGNICSSSSDEPESEMTSSTGTIGATVVFSFVCVRARERSLARSAISPE